MAARRNGGSQGQNAACCWFQVSAYDKRDRSVLLTDVVGMPAETSPAEPEIFGWSTLVRLNSLRSEWGIHRLTRGWTRRLSIFIPSRLVFGHVLVEIGLIILFPWVGSNYGCLLSDHGPCDGYSRAMAVMKPFWKSALSIETLRWESGSILRSESCMVFRNGKFLKITLMYNFWDGASLSFSGSNGYLLAHRKGHTFSRFQRKLRIQVSISQSVKSYRSTIVLSTAETSKDQPHMNVLAISKWVTRGFSLWNRQIWAFSASVSGFFRWVPDAATAFGRADDI